MFRTHPSNIHLCSAQAGILLLQSVILGFLTEYFNIEQPTERDTRNAYLYALGTVCWTTFCSALLERWRTTNVSLVVFRLGDSVSGGGSHALS